MIAEIVFWRCLQDEPTLFVQYFRVHDHVGHLVYILQWVGWPGKDHIVTAPCSSQKPEHIFLDNVMAFHLQSLFRSLANELDADGREINRSYIPASSGIKFIRDIAGTGKKVKEGYFIEIEYIIQNIEQSFLCNVSCWAGRDIPGWHESHTSVISSYDSH